MSVKSSPFLSIDMRGVQGRILVIGDVHGRFDLLRRQLDRLKYDQGRDRIIFLGDLVNRGPYSAQVGEWWSELRVLGNHEQMVSWMAHGALGQHSTKGHADWIRAMPEAERKVFADELCDAPYAMEITTPAGRHAGFVHAQVPSLPPYDWRTLLDMMKERNHPFHLQAIAYASDIRYDWSIARSMLSDTSHPHHHLAAEQAIWARSHSTLVKLGLDAPWVDGIDHVFFGHTRFPAVMVNRNCSWIDTGAYATERLTVLDVDAWLDRVESERRAGRQRWIAE